MKYNELYLDKISRFPHDVDIRNLWISATKRINWVPKKSSKICSEHFDAKLLWKKEKKAILNPDAVPNAVIITFFYINVHNLHLLILK